MSLPSHNEEFSDHSRSFANELLYEFRARDSDECALGVVSHGPGQQCLACARWTVQ